MARFVCSLRKCGDLLWHLGGGSFGWHRHHFIHSLVIHHVLTIWQLYHAVWFGHWCCILLLLILRCHLSCVIWLLLTTKTTGVSILNVWLLFFTALLVLTVRLLNIQFDLFSQQTAKLLTDAVFFSKLPREVSWAVSVMDDNIFILTITYFNCYRHYFFRYRLRCNSNFLLVMLRGAAHYSWVAVLSSKASIERGCLEGLWYTSTSVFVYIKLGMIHLWYKISACIHVCR